MGRIDAESYQSFMKLRSKATDTVSYKTKERKRDRRTQDRIWEEDMIKTIEKNKKKGYTGDKWKEKMNQQNHLLKDEQKLNSMQQKLISSISSRKAEENLRSLQGTYLNTTFCNSNVGNSSYVTQTTHRTTSQTSSTKHQSEVYDLCKTPIENQRKQKIKEAALRSEVTESRSSQKSTGKVGKGKGVDLVSSIMEKLPKDNIDQESMKRIWDAACGYIERQLVTNIKGVNFKGIGIFTFKKPKSALPSLSASLDSSIRISELSQQLQKPLLFLSPTLKQLIRQKKIRTDAYHASTDGYVHVVPMSYSQVALNAHVRREDVQMVLSNVVNQFKQEIQSRRASPSYIDCKICIIVVNQGNYAIKWKRKFLDKLHERSITAYQRSVKRNKQSLRLKTPMTSQTPPPRSPPKSSISINHVDIAEDALSTVSSTCFSIQSEKQLVFDEEKERKAEIERQRLEKEKLAAYERELERVRKMFPEGKPNLNYFMQSHGKRGPGRQVKKVDLMASWQDSLKNKKQFVEKERRMDRMQRNICEADARLSKMRETNSKIKQRNREQAIMFENLVEAKKKQHKEDVLELGDIFAQQRANREFLDSQKVKPAEIYHDLSQQVNEKKKQAEAMQKAYKEAAQINLFGRGVTTASERERKRNMGKKMASDLKKQIRHRQKREAASREAHRQFKELPTYIGSDLEVYTRTRRTAHLLRELHQQEIVEHEERRRQEREEEKELERQQLQVRLNKADERTAREKAHQKQLNEELKEAWYKQ